MDCTAESFLVLQKIQSDQYMALCKIIINVFNWRKEVSAEGLLLFNAMLHASGEYVSEERVSQSVGELAPFIEHAMIGNYGNKVAMDGMICAASVAMRLKIETHKFFEQIMTPFDEIIANCNPRDHNLMNVALSSYSDFAFYTQALFKPYAEQYIKTLTYVEKQILAYWDEKDEHFGQQPPEMMFFEFDEDDRMCLTLTEALIDAYHNTIMAAEQGKWRSKLTGVALNIAYFYQTAVIKMSHLMNPIAKADIGLGFADILRTLKDMVFNWFA